MNPADSKWLEILKASGWQTAALTAAFGIFIILVKTKIIPTTDNPLWIALPALGALTCGFLSLANIGDQVTKLFRPGLRFNAFRRKRRDQKMVRDFISYMTEKDRTIIGYLLHHNEKMFQYEDTGGYAASLISKGIICAAGKHGQIIDSQWVPFEIPDHIWTVLEGHRDSFPYEPPADEKHPWAIHWLVR